MNNRENRRATLNLAARAIYDASALLWKASGDTITEAMARADDGTLDLLRYAAWLARAIGQGGAYRGDRNSEVKGAASRLSAPIDAPRCTRSSYLSFFNSARMSSGLGRSEKVLPRRA